MYNAVEHCDKDDIWRSRSADACVNALYPGIMFPLFPVFLLFIHRIKKQRSSDDAGAYLCLFLDDKIFYWLFFFVIGS